MSREKMLQARELIQAKRFDEARQILVTIDHPKAKQWLDRIEKARLIPDIQIGGR